MIKKERKAMETICRKDIKGKANPRGRTSTQTPSSLHSHLRKSLLLMLVLASLLSYSSAMLPEEFLSINDKTCDEVDGYAEDLYIEELFARMLQTDGSSQESSSSPERWERIIAFKMLNSTRRRRLTFNISMLKENDNLTMAKVAVVTDGRRKPCHSAVMKFRRQGKLPCENKPFRILYLATFDVTSLLAPRLGHSLFHVYVRHYRYLVEAMLIVFNDINTAQLFSVPDSGRCKMFGIRNKRSASFQRLTKHQSTNSFPSLRNWREKTRGIDRRSGPGRRQDDTENEETAPQSTWSNGLAAVKGFTWFNRDANDLRQQIPRLRRALPKDGRSVESTARFDLQGQSARGNKPQDRQQNRNDFGHKFDENEDIPENERNRSGTVRTPAHGQFKQARRFRSIIPEMSDPSERAVPESPSELLHQLNLRRKRSVSVQYSETAESYTRAPESCRVENYGLTPEIDLQMTGFISPGFLEIGRCDGECLPILLPSSGVTMYSHIISVLYGLSRNQTLAVPHPGCRPSRFQSFSVMRMEGDALLIERWRNARVIECSCI